MFRMRPKTAVDVAGSTICTPELQPAEGKHGVVAKPSLTTTHASAEMAFLDRLYRGRPKTAVSSSTADAWLTGSANQTLVPAATIPAFTPPLEGLAPASHERFFRTRPRTGVGIETASLLGTIEADPAAALVAPEITGLPAGSAGEFAPALQVRLCGDD